MGDWCKNCFFFYSYYFCHWIEEKIMFNKDKNSIVNLVNIVTYSCCCGWWNWGQRSAVSLSYLLVQPQIRKITCVQYSCFTKIPVFTFMAQVMITYMEKILALWRAVCSCQFFSHTKAWENYVTIIYLFCNFY